MGNIDRNLPTIVLTHGLQNGPFSETLAGGLWTGTGPTQASTLLEAATSNRVNVIQYIWEDAFQGAGGLWINDYKTAQSYVTNAAGMLAKELIDALGPTYDKAIQFVGHSLGTAVNAFAASLFVGAEEKVPAVQFTALDRPDDVSPIPGLTGNAVTYGEDFFATALAPVSEKLGNNFFIDNYYSLNGAGVGNVANGSRVYNLELEEPNDVGGVYFENEGADNNHSGVQQWYRWTIDPNAQSFRDSNPFDFSTCNKQVWTWQALGLDGGLNPCNQGWAWALLNPDRIDVPEFTQQSEI